MLLTESKEGSYSVHLESGSVEQHFMVTLCPCPSDLQLEGGAGANGRRLSSEAESANAKTILSCFPPDLHKSSPRLSSGWTQCWGHSWSSLSVIMGSPMHEGA